MAEHAKVRELVDDDRLERLRRGEDQPPGEREPALTRGAAPARPLVADADGGRRRRRGPSACRAISRSISPRGRGLSHASRTAPIGRRSAGGEADDELVLVGRHRHARRWSAGGPGRAGTTRSRWRSPRKRTCAPSRRAAAGRDRSARSRAWSIEMAAEPRLALGEERVDVPLRVGPAASAGGGTVTTTPRSGWMTTRGRATVANDEACTATGPPGSRATPGLGRRPRRGCDAAPRASVTRRSRRPGRSPVSTPSRIADPPVDDHVRRSRSDTAPARGRSRRRRPSSGRTRPGRRTRPRG